MFFSSFNGLRLVVEDRRCGRQAFHSSEIQNFRTISLVHGHSFVPGQILFQYTRGHFLRPRFTFIFVCRFSYWAYT